DFGSGGLVIGAPYTYRIRAAAANSVSSFSNDSTIRALFPPGTLTADLIGATTIKLTWIDTNTLETGYLIQRIIGTEGTFEDLTTVPANTTTFTDSGLDPDKLHTYRIRAVNANASSSLGNNAAVTTHRIPVAPSGLEA